MEKSPLSKLALLRFATAMIVAGIITEFVVFGDDTTAYKSWVGEIILHGLTAAIIAVPVLVILFYIEELFKLPRSK